MHAICNNVALQSSWVGYVTLCWMPDCAVLVHLHAPLCCMQPGPRTAKHSNVRWLRCSAASIMTRNSIGWLKGLQCSKCSLSCCIVQLGISALHCCGRMKTRLRQRDCAWRLCTPPELLNLLKSRCLLVFRPICPPPPAGTVYCGLLAPVLDEQLPDNGWTYAVVQRIARSATATCFASYQQQGPHSSLKYGLSSTTNFAAGSLNVPFAWQLTNMR